MRKPKKDDVNTAERVNWKIILAILLALIIIPAMQPGLNVYSVTVNLLVLLVVALLVVAVVALLIAFVLLREGMRLGLLCLKVQFPRVAGWCELHLVHSETMERPALRH